MPQRRNPGKPHSRVHRGAMGSRQALIDLPAEGCALPVPPMPSGRDWTSAQRARWRELWGSPQATQWDETARGTVAALLISESEIIAIDADRDVADEPSAGLDADLEPYAGLGESHVAHLGDERPGAVEGVWRLP
jgi:hypothetical protein